MGEHRDATGGRRHTMETLWLWWRWVSGPPVLFSPKIVSIKISFDIFWNKTQINLDKDGVAIILKWM